MPHDNSGPRTPDISTMSIQQLKSFITSRGLIWADCIEKRELQSRAMLAANTSQAQADRSRNTTAEPASEHRAQHHRGRRGARHGMGNHGKGRGTHHGNHGKGRGTGVRLKVDLSEDSEYTAFKEARLRDFKTKRRQARAAQAAARLPDSPEVRQLAQDALEDPQARFQLRAMCSALDDNQDEDGACNNTLAADSLDEDCPICLEALSDAVKVITLGCAHRCCLECWWLWEECCSAKNESATCPLCREETAVTSQHLSA